MTEVLCGIKAFDIHELFPHFLAKRLGFYADEGLSVRVVDVTFTPDEKLPQESYFQVACGAAYLGRREGFPFTVLLAAATRPMFWLHARPEIESVEALRGKRVATYPAVAPPHYFHRVLLRRHGLDPDRDLYEFRWHRDDIIRLGLLRENDVDAALLSSAVSPARVQRLGLRTLALTGDEVGFVTTGVATLRPIVDRQPDLIQAVVRAHQRGLRAIHEREQDATETIADILRESDDVAAETYAAIRHCYTETGSVDLDELEPLVQAVGAEVTAGSDVAARNLYDFSLL